jgi:hypothetical protein
LDPHVSYSTPTNYERYGYRSHFGGERKVIGCASSKIDFMRFPHPPEGMGLQCASFWEPLIEFCIFLDQEEEQAQSANPNHSSLIIH